RELRTACRHATSSSLLRRTRDATERVSQIATGWPTLRPRPSLREITGFPPLATRKGCTTVRATAVYLTRHPEKLFTCKGPRQSALVQAERALIVRRRYASSPGGSAVRSALEIASESPATWPRAA